MVAPHCKSQIEKRGINVDLEMIEYLVTKSKGIDSAFILGEQEFLSDDCWIILIVRHNVAITIEFRRKSQCRKSQSLNESSLKVEQIVKFPCIF